LTGIIGWERERGHKTAGLRTHMLVALGSCSLILACLEGAASADATTRAVQGIAAGVGFIGAGAIMKSMEQHRVRGLTTAGSIWVAAGIGITCGFGHYGVGVAAVLATWIVLVPLEFVKEKLDQKNKRDPGETKKGEPG
jgi:putative Mg2+ transporter-C (MgtC) family protein